MSLRTRIRGFTAWVNFRLMPYNQLLNNVLMDLLRGTNMKVLIESITGRELQHLESFDGLTDQQKLTRFDWIVEELKKCQVIPKDVKVDCRMCAMRNADHVFQLLWRLISHDLWFVWERLEYLQHNDEDVLTQVIFKWTPDPPPAKKKKAKPKSSLLSGFGSAAVVDEEPVKMEHSFADVWDKFPGEEFVKKFKTKYIELDYVPKPDECILEFVTTQLKKTKEGRKLNVMTLDDLADSRVLCALVNSFAPNTFNTEMLLNDRWTINLALRTIEKMFHAQTPFDSEDLVEADTMSVCAYFCFFFMIGYKFRQCKAAVNRIDWLYRLVRECYHNLDLIPAMSSIREDLQQRQELKLNIDNHREAIAKLEKRFDIDYCRDWIAWVEKVQLEVRKEVHHKIKQKFEIIEVPRNMTITDICLSMVINLHLTNGSAFLLSDGTKETLTDGKRMVLRDKKTGEFIDEFTGKSKVSIKKLLRLPLFGFCEVCPENYPQYEFFFECQSRNKQVKAGTELLYQIFPGSTVTWQRLFIKAAKDNDFDTLEKMVTVFKDSPHFINCKEPKTWNTPLHWAARNGYKEIVEYLLENGANMEAKNSFKCTPIYNAIEGLHRDVAHLLIEWGCNMHTCNIKDQTPIETVKNDDFKMFLVDLYNHYSMSVPKIMEGDEEMLADLVQAHKTDLLNFASLRSRCINGSTLLHTAAYFGNLPVLKELLQLRVDVNLLDYKHSTPIHRARDVDTMKELIDAGGDFMVEDSEGNTPLHVKCYGETGEKSEVDCIELLLDRGSSLTHRNKRGLMPVHCCAMQGRVDVIKLLLQYDEKDEIVVSLNDEDGDQPPSVLYLSLANDHVQSAQWLIETGFCFKDGEADLLLKRILTEQITISNQLDVINFLLCNGADPNPKYPGGNTCLHYAAGMGGGTEILELLLSHGADIDTPNLDGNTPLFFSTKANNQLAACILLAHGANMRTKNLRGMTAFDSVVDFEEWVESGYFNDDVKARLKAYSLKHARDLVRAITKKVKGNVRERMGGLSLSNMISPNSSAASGRKAVHWSPDIKAIPTKSRQSTALVATTNSAVWSVTASHISSLPPVKSVQ